MAILAAGTRLLLMGRSTSAAVINTVVGSPARFDAAVVDASVRMPAGSGFLEHRFPGGAMSELWSHHEHMAEGGNGVFFYLYEILDANGNAIAAIYQGNGNWQVEVRQGVGSLSNRGAIGAPNNTALTRYDFHWIGGANWTFEAWQNGVPWFSLSGSNGPTNQAAAIRMRPTATGFTNSNFSQYALANADDLRGRKFGSTVLNGTGAYNDGTGTPAQTGDGDFSTGKALAAAGDRFLGTKPAYNVPMDMALEAVAVNAFVRAGGAVPNARIITRTAGVDGQDGNLSPAPGLDFSVRSRILTTNPATGLPFDDASFDATEFGIEARA